MKVAYIDIKFIYRISEDSEILIIFQKPRSVSKKQIEQVFDKIEGLVKKMELMFHRLILLNMLMILHLMNP